MGKLDDYQQKWAELVERESHKGYNKLSSDEKIWFNLQILIQAIYDGGLVSYYYNSGADYLTECEQALHTIGAERMKLLLSRVNKLFPEGVPLTLKERNSVINAWPDDSSVDRFLDPIEEAALREADLIEEKLISFIKNRKLAG